MAKQIFVNQNLTDGDSVTTNTSLALVAGATAIPGTAKALLVDSSGRPLVTIDTALPAGSNTIGAVNLAQYTPVSGRLPVDGSGVTIPVKSATTQTSGSITGTAQTVALAVTDYSNVVFTIQGTYAAVNITFEGSIDAGTTYFTVNAVRSDSNTVETTSGSLTNTTRAWEASVNGLTHFRVRSTAYTSGTATIRIVATTVGGEPVPAIATHAVTLASITTSIVPGTAATNLGKAEDAVHTSGDVGVMGLAVRRDTASSLAGADNDYLPLTTDSSGRLWVNNSSVTQPISAASLPLPSGAATSANQSTIIGHVDGIEGLLTTIDADTSTLAATDFATQTTLAAINAKLVTGTDIGDVTINNAAGGSAVNIQDGGNSITVDGTVSSTQGTTPWTTKEIGFDSLPVYHYNYLSLVNVPVTLFIDPTTLSVSSVVNNAVVVTGDEAHDAVDDGNPNKIGYKARDYTPDTSDTYNGGLTAVAENDRANATSNLFGQPIEGVNSYFFTLDNVSTTYNNTTTTATSTAKAAWNYRQATFSYELTKANSPTDILFEIEISLNNGSTYTVQQNDFLGDLRESAASVASGIKKSVTFPIGCSHIRVKATATGTTASATFTVANACIYFRN